MTHHQPSAYGPNGPWRTDHFPSMLKRRTDERGEVMGIDSEWIQVTREYLEELYAEIARLRALVEVPALKAA